MIEAIIIGLAVLLDQLTKIWATTALAEGAITIIPKVLDFNYFENTGAAFSMLSSGTWFLSAVSAIMSIVLLFIIFKYRNKMPRFVSIMLAFLASGAIGNLIDRLFAGYVVDFIEFTFVNFAVFNVADIYVTCSAIALGVYLIFTK
ncbi:MAG: signal peptidase II, partial [Christensenellaceae bacterium]|nr:signal peptidase II [Christensenellaceae bacterium]